ncbi:hypothetical protein EST38_g1658 [Candolleomyces aberdarensis]|uniref:Uncharacterized protein n=1 Tax=Candolleomyces aberdarensis TaxID=2316362 RepID=A0A4Q2DY05_9AGAR|nr:hypothetical protein EST38_g1658 [Candolleomyces aberdarensis]
MTEYDYSPEAWERHIATQQRIARWVDGTLTQAPCNAFSPATPHVNALKLEKERKHRRKEEERRAYYPDAGDSDVSDDYDSRYARSSHKSHRKTRSTKETSSHRSPRKDRSRERYDRERERRDRHQDYDRSSARHYKPEKAQKDIEYVWVERDSPSPPSSTRPRSSSQSVASKPRPSRSHAAPQLSLDLQAFPQRPQDPYYYHNRHSHSSQSSATTPNSGSTTHGMFPVGQLPHSAPAITGQAPMLGGTPAKPIRSQTMPYVYPGYQQVTDKHGYPVSRPVGPQPVVVPIRPNMTGSNSYGSNLTYAPDPSKHKQLPWSTYQSPSKSQSLLKRMFGFKAKNSNESTPPPQPYYPPQSRDDKEGGSMFLGGGKRMTRKRSISF